MAYPKGAPRPQASGRKKGTPNKATQTVKTALESAFRDLGGKAYLLRLGEDHPDIFARLLLRLIPQQVSDELIGKAKPLTIKFNVASEKDGVRVTRGTKS